MNKVGTICYATIWALLILSAQILASGKIYYGAWTQGMPSYANDQQVQEFYDTLAATLGFNLIIGTAPPNRCALLGEAGLKAIGHNINEVDELNESIDPYPEMYSIEATYVTFLAKGQELIPKVV
ncbi:MAG: hypothetical protein WBP42_09915 [Candidatus Zixiibacteriota bacterium]